MEVDFIDISLIILAILFWFILIFQVLISLDYPLGEYY